MECTFYLNCRLEKGITMRKVLRLGLSLFLAVSKPQRDLLANGSEKLGDREKSSQSSE